MLIPSYLKPLQVKCDVIFIVFYYLCVAIPFQLVGYKTYWHVNCVIHFSQQRFAVPNFLCKMCFYLLGLYSGMLLTRFVLWHVEESSDVDWGVRLIMQVVSRVIHGVRDKTVELIMHVICNVTSLLCP